ncbi:MAG: L(+)-tartrate dehydratase subunit beta [Candidatus Bathyarchaeia archaeon]
MSVTVRTPIEDKDLDALRAGDVAYLDGVLVTCRDSAHKRFLEKVAPLPISLKGSAIFHAGPIVSKAEGVWRIVSIGPTTSMRMEAYEYDFIQRTGLKLIIGKGGMGARTAEACRRFHAVHAVFPGGCAVVAADKVQRVEGVEWLDLGMPEALWIMRVKGFGPLIVSIDTRGENLFDEKRRAVELRRLEAVQSLRDDLLKAGVG